MAKNKLFSIREVWSGEREKIDSVAQHRYEYRGENIQILFEAQRCWDNMDAFRKERDRCKRYSYGNQWDDRICVNGKSMSEEDIYSLKAEFR